MSHVPTYSEVEEEIVSVTLNLSNYVTQKEFKSLTKVDTSDCALKTNIAEIKKKIDDINVDKIDFIDELQGKNYIEDSYLYLHQKYKYSKYDKTDTKRLLSWQSAGISNEKLTLIKDANSPSLLYEETKPYLKISFFKFLAQRKIYTHKGIVNNLEIKVTNNELTTKTSINNLKNKVNGIGLTKYVLKSNYGTKIVNIELKIPDVSGKLNASDFNSKVIELENKIKVAEQKPHISNLATIDSVTAVIKTIPDVEGFVKKLTMQQK